jgi:transcriptional regulator with XRE-family HTH domain
MSIQTHIGRKVAEFRKGKGWSQEQLGFECKLHRTYISQVERGVINPTVGSLESIAKKLDVACWQLVEPR